MTEASMLFAKVSLQIETQPASCETWKRITNFISWDNDNSTKQSSMYSCTYVFFLETGYPHVYKLYIIPIRRYDKKNYILEKTSRIITLKYDRHKTYIIDNNICHIIEI